MKQETALEILRGHVAADARHAGYQRANEVAEFAKMIVTGGAKEQEKEVTRYRRFEKDGQKKQRVRLYNPLTRYAIARPRKYWQKVARVPGVKIVATGSDESKMQRLNGQMADFANNQTLFEWAVDTLEYLGVTDPNAWILFERYDVFGADGQKKDVATYPVIIPSINVLDFKQMHGKTLWLLWREIRIEQDRHGNDVTLETLYLYQPGGLTRAREKGDETMAEAGEIEVVMSAKPKDRIFLVSEYRNGTTETPAICAGAYVDESNERAGFVTWFEPAHDVLKDLIRHKSNLDVATALYAMPQKYEYVKPCQYEDNGGHCDGGYIRGGEHDGERCAACGGSGKVANFTTEQEVLQLVLPDNAGDILELAKLYHYEQGNIAVPEWLAGQVEKTEERVMKAIFSAADIERATGAATATEKNYQMEDVYDVLEPFCKKVKLTAEMAYRVAAQYLEIGDFSVSVFIPKDKKMKTLGELIASMKEAKDSGAGWDVVRDLRRQIWEKMNEDDPERVRKLEAQYEWLPFDDKSPEELAQIMASRAPTDYARVLRENWAEIFGELEKEVPDFHLYEYTKQREIVGAKVAAIVEKISLAGGSQIELPPMV